MFGSYSSLRAAGSPFPIGFGGLSWIIFGEEEVLGMGDVARATRAWGKGILVFLVLAWDVGMIF